MREEYSKRHGRPTHMVSCVGSETIADVINKLAENHIHRVYIVDDANKPVGLVSLKDLLAEILQ
jgi:CBS domain-containing protein